MSLGWAKYDAWMFLYGENYDWRLAGTFIRVIRGSFNNREQLQCNSSWIFFGGNFFFILTLRIIQWLLNRHHLESPNLEVYHLYFPFPIPIWGSA